MKSEDELAKEALLKVRDVYLQGLGVAFLVIVALAAILFPVHWLHETLEPDLWCYRPWSAGPAVEFRSEVECWRHLSLARGAGVAGLESAACVKEKSP